MSAKKSVVFMAFSAGQESRDGAAGAARRFIGVGSVHVLAMCPNAAKLSEIFGGDNDNEPVYIGEADRDGEKIRFARLSFVLRANAEDNEGVEMTCQSSLFVREAFRYNRDKTKVQVIDKFGRTAWVTRDELSTHEIPTYRTGDKALLDKDYRPCYQGEEDLTNFFKAFLNIPSPMVYKNKEWVPAEHPEDCYARFDNLRNIFSGNFKELNDALSLQPNNKVKVLFGIRTAADGSQYQDIYTRMFMRNGTYNYERLEKDVHAAQESGGFPNTEFRVVPLQEYVVTPTPLEESQPVGISPFGDPSKNPFFQ